MEQYHHFHIFRFSTLLDPYEQSQHRKPIKQYFLEQRYAFLMYFCKSTRIMQVCDRKYFQFYHILFQQLHTIHTGFHSEIQKSVGDKKGHHKNSIADCFTKWKPKFLIYGEFCSNLTKAQDMVDELSRRNPMIAQNIEVTF